MMDRYVLYSAERHGFFSRFVPGYSEERGAFFDVSVVANPFGDDVMAWGSEDQIRAFFNDVARIIHPDYEKMFLNFIMMKVVPYYDEEAEEIDK